MEIRFVAPELRALDRISGDAVLVGHCEDERPLRGVSGAIDWRLCGRLSRLILSGRATGKLGSAVLLPGRPRLGFERIVLVGLGPIAELDAARAGVATRAMLEVLDGLVARTAAIALPGRTCGSLSAESAVEALLGALEHAREVDELHVIEPPEAARSVAAVIERARRRARATAEP